MKYVVFSVPAEQGAEQELPVIFPLSINHSDMASAVMLMLHRQRLHAQIVSAGFIDWSTNKCSGLSESLGGVPSRPERDAGLIATHDFTRGLIDERHKTPPNHR